MNCWKGEEKMTKSSLKAKLSAPLPDELQILDDELFGILPGPDNRKSSSDVIVNISLQKLIPYKDQRFRMYSSEKLEELADSIATEGLLSPLIVRPMPNELGFYEILSGRNRAKAFELLEKEEVPCIIHETNDAQAKCIVSSANLQQRRDLLPSEEAYGYKMQLDGRTILQIAEKFNTNRKNIFRFLRLTELIDELLNMVDDNQIPVGAGIDLSYLTVIEQHDLVEFLRANEINKISARKASELRKMSERKNLTDEQLEKILLGAPHEKVALLKLPGKKIVSLIPPDEDIEKYIVNALQFFQAHGSASLNGGDTDDE